jgi:hypothetical protein
MFVLAGVGAMITLLLQGAPNLPGTVESRSLDKQENAARSQEKDVAKQEKAAPQPEREEESARQQGEVEYPG